MSAEDTILELVDVHCHVDLYGKDEAMVLEEIEHRRIHTIAVTNAPSVFFHTRDLAESRNYLHPAVGLHPELVTSHGHELDRMWSYLSETRFVGEIGLDYVTSDLELRRRQREVFSQILGRCAEYGDKVLTVHSRRSATDVIAMIGDHFPGTVILHWFSGTARELERAATAGCWFSVNPAMFRSQSGVELVKLMPTDRVLTESDGPFVKEKGRPCTPADSIDALRGLSKTWSISTAEAARRVADNFQRALSTLR